MPNRVDTAESTLYKKYEPTPLLRGYSKIKLFALLVLKQRWRLIHICNWVYWKYGKADRLHRVCDKCYRKQKLDFNKWVNDSVV
jgi:hypothetical protein